jgi:hypothetical protein
MSSRLQEGFAGSHISRETPAERFQANCCIDRLNPQLESGRIASTICKEMLC